MLVLEVYRMPERLNIGLEKYCSLVKRSCKRSDADHCSASSGSVEKGATAQANARPSPKDLFKMHNSSTPSAPQALANRPVSQDPISEADHVVSSEPILFFPVDCQWAGRCPLQFEQPISWCLPLQQAFKFLGSKTSASSEELS